MVGEGKGEMVYPLKKCYLYGPIDSRRYGRSLGINLSPCAYKLCSFNCVYCHYGRTETVAADHVPYEGDMPTMEEVLVAVEVTLRSPEELDVITFSGNGEPTKHPRFPEIVGGVVALRDRFRPKAKVVLLSNATGLVREEVRRSLSKIDLPVLKLDAGTPKTFLAINRPDSSVHFDDIVAALSQVERFYVQTVFIDGKPSNTTEEELSAYIQLLAKLRPQEAHIYSIERPVPDKGIARVSPERLEEIAARIGAEAGVRAIAYYTGKGR